MKLFLRSVSLIVISLLAGIRGQSQCTVSDIIIQNIRGATSNAPGTCTVTFDASFRIENNNGNKYIFIHAWTEADYPNYFHCVNGQTTLNGSIAAPEGGDLGNEFLTIAINNDDDPPTLMTSYTPDQAVPITPATSIERTVLPDGSAIFIIRDITATLPIACGTPTVIMADLWSSQSAQAQRAHCVNCGIRFGAGFVGVQGLVNCTNLTFNARITKNIPQDITGFYTIHADVNGDGYYSPMIDTIVIDTTNFSITGGAGAFVNVTGNLLQANLNQDVFIVITLTSGPAPGTTRVTLLPSGICGSLPVTFRSFTASRVDANRVTLRWETATEINNAGFTILRNNGPAWEQVMYVPSHAAGGNSTSALTYNFMDQNSHRGMTQYRIRQVDLDGKIKMSDIRAVRGEGQTTQLIVYPNPSNNGNVNVVFNDQNVTRDAILIDMSGRTIRQWQGVTSNTIQVENLLPGIYTFRSTTRETGFHDSGKIVVTK